MNKTHMKSNKIKSLLQDIVKMYTVHMSVVFVDFGLLVRNYAVNAVHRIECAS